MTKAKLWKNSLGLPMPGSSAFVMTIVDCSKIFQEQAGEKIDFKKEFGRAIIIGKIYLMTHMWKPSNRKNIKK